MLGSDSPNIGHGTPSANCKMFHVKSVLVPFVP